MSRMPGGPGVTSIVLIAAGAILLILSMPCWLWAGVLGLALILAGALLWQRC